MNTNIDWCTFCRICLQEEAVIPLFENDRNEKPVCSKLMTCIQEQVLDIDGYPKFICLRCNETLDSILDLIKTYKESCKTLQNHFSSIVKNEEHQTVKDEYSESKVEFDAEIISEDTKDWYVHCESITTVEQPSKKIDTIKKKDINSNSNKISSVIKIPSVKVKRNRFQKLRLSTRVKNKSKVEDNSECCNTKIENNLEEKETIKHRADINHTIDNLCDLCGGVFKNRAQLHGHQNRAHSTEKFKCSNCEKVCNTKYDLNRHFQRLHADNKKIKCDQCGQKFAFKKDLTGHIKNVHEKHKYPKKIVTHTCQYCTKTYVSKQSLVIHERSAHSGYRPAICSVCNAAFFHISYLKQHMLLHTGETPYKCPVCKRGYSQWGNMKSHMRNHRKSDIDEDILKNIKPNLLKCLRP